MQHVVNVSGGMASAICLFRVIEKYGKENTFPVFADTNSEDADLYRFLDDVARVAGSEIVRLTNEGKTIWDVFFSSVMFTTLASGCKASWELKKVPLEKWHSANFNPDDCIINVGFGPDEIKRQHRLIEAMKPRGWKVDFPLNWTPRLGRCDLADELRGRGIEPPRLYARGYSHNNCGGACILAGIGQWSGLLEDNLELYRQNEEKEKLFIAELEKRGRPVVTILKDRRGGVVNNLSLEQLRLELERGERKQVDWKEHTCTCMAMLF